MQFEEQTAAIRQMKELLRDQAKFRAKLDRVVRKIETSSERTAKLAERNRTRKGGSGSAGGGGNSKGGESPAAPKNEAQGLNGHSAEGAEGDQGHPEMLTSAPAAL